MTPPSSAWIRLPIVIALLSTIAACAFAFRGFQTRSLVDNGQSSTKSLNTYNSGQLMQALNDLKTDLNVTFGFLNGNPRLSLGPCGELSDEFRQSWNSRFPSPAEIVFVKVLDDSYCRHVLIRLPNGWFFDGGRGVMAYEELMQLYQDVHGRHDPTMHLEVMSPFDESIFRESTVTGPYANCPGFSRTKARQIIDRHLDRLLKVLSSAGRIRDASAE